MIGPQQCNGQLLLVSDSTPAYANVTTIHKELKRLVSTFRICNRGTRKSISWVTAIPIALPGLIMLNAMRIKIQLIRALSTGTTRTAYSSADAAVSQQMHVPNVADQRLLVVAVIGLPNAGKSTLVNRLIGAKISGVSSKRNTTITPQLGCCTVGDSQVLLYDTPGLVDASVQGSPLERLKSAWSTAAMADQLLFIVDAERQFRLREPLLLKLAQQLAAGPPSPLLGQWKRPPAALFLNKQDRLPNETRGIALQQLGKQLSGIVEFDRVFHGAAMLGQGVDELRDYFIQQARPAPWVMAADQVHSSSAADLAVELVREKLYRRLNQELPYTLSVSAESVQELPHNEGLFIRLSVAVKNKRVKAMVVGKGGEIIQGYVTQPTAKELERLLNSPVKLVVSVKAADG